MPSSRRVQLHGPKPEPLTLIAKDSYQIKKKQQQQQESQPPPLQITYVHSPKIIHTKPQDFMGLVQRLTGNNSKSGLPGGSSTCKTSAVVVGRPTRDDLVDGNNTATDIDDHDDSSASSDPLHLSLGQLLPSTVSPSAVSPGFFLSPNTNACLQELGLLF